MAYTERVAASQPHHEAMALGGWLLPPTPRAADEIPGKMPRTPDVSQSQTRPGERLRGASMIRETRRNNGR